jgi:K+/H+ antiporter YhaU regulatory subunit KhtT
LAGRTLAQIDLRRRCDVTILAIRRDDQTVSNPGGDAPLLPGDELIVMGGPEEMDELVEFFRTGDGAQGEAGRPSVTEGHPVP